MNSEVAQVEQAPTVEVVKQTPAVVGTGSGVDGGMIGGIVGGATGGIVLLGVGGYMMTKKEKTTVAAVGPGKTNYASNTGSVA